MAPTRTSGFLLVALTILVSTHAEVIQLTSDNVEQVFAQYELVFINFYADWCRFSQMLTPIFSEASDAVIARFPLHLNQVALARVDCDRESEIAQRFKISKYPTLKTFRFGEPMKREYRGQRSAEAFFKYVSEQMVNPLKVLESHEEMEAIEDDHRNMLAYMENSESNNYKNLVRAASQLRSDCNWYTVVGEPALEHRKNGEDVIYFRQPLRQGSDLPFTGLTNVEALTDWARDLCVPRVRVLTFNNAEELTEEGIPFLVLFHHPDDKESPELFAEQVNLQLANDRDSVTALTADGIQFAHPLQHLGKSAHDLPIIAIDSFKHMYILPHDVKTRGLREDGLLKQFVDDLASGKLHREFHYGPDQVTQPPHVQHINQGDPNAVNGDGRPPPPQGPGQTSPPESVFKKLMPSHNRYTVLRDEL